MNFNKTSLKLLIVLSTISCFSCNTNKNDYKTKSDVFISEFFKGVTYLDSAIEIANVSDKNVNLNNYKLTIYSLDKVQKEIVIDSEIDSKSCIVLINKDFDTSLIDIQNYIVLDDNYLTGDKYIELNTNRNKLVDCIGTKNFDLSYIEKSSLVKLDKYFNGHSNFSNLYFVKISELNTKYLGNLNFPLSYDDLLFGPHLEESYHFESLLKSQTIGSGGYKNVSIVSLGDGDTTIFKFNDEVNLDVESVRYLMINTPEISYGYGESEFMGDEAKEFNNEKLRNAKHILVQSNKDYALRETYDRLLGYVWYSNEQNASLKDYKLLNYELVLNGYARFDSRDRYQTMFYKDIYYSSYLEYGYNYALVNKLGVFSN